MSTTARLSPGMWASWHLRTGDTHTLCLALFSVLFRYQLHTVEVTVTPIPPMNEMRHKDQANSP